MTGTATVATGSGATRLWRRDLAGYPNNAARVVNLTIVVLATITLYYQFYLAGAVATRIIAEYQMSFVYYVNISVVGYILGAAASFTAGLADRYGRANIVTVGLLLTGLLCLFAIPHASTKLTFGIAFIAVGVVEGIILVATPALIRDFSPQLGRASAMGFWTLGPVLGSLVVSIVVSTSSNTRPWQDQYIVCGVVGLVIFALAAVGLRELAPGLRDQLMVSSRDRALIEARAKGIDIAASLRNPFKQMLKPDIITSAFAISVFLIIYYLAVGFFPVFFQTVYGYTLSEANALGNWFWGFDALALLVIGFLSDLIRVRKPFMLVGAVLAIVFTVIFTIKATDPHTSYNTFVVLLILISVFLGVAYAPWMASFTETVERRNPALTATGLAVWGLVIRIVIALAVFFVPLVVNSVTPLVDSGPQVQAIASGQDPNLSPAENATVKAIAANPAAIATSGPLDANVQTALKYLQANAPAVMKAAADSPKQWQTYFWVAVGGEVVFIPFIFVMAGFWDPRKARKQQQEHQAWVDAEMAKLHAD